MYTGLFHIQLILALTSTIYAQQTRYGVKAGLSSSTIKVEAENVSYTFDSKNSFYAGGFLEHKLNEKFAIQAEALYAQLGGTMHEEDYYNGYEVEVSNDTTVGTLLIPVGAKYYITNALALGAGLNLGLVLSAEDVTTGKYNGETETETTDIKDDLESTMLAPFVGAEYSFTNNLFIDARYNMGVTDVLKNTEDATSRVNFFQVGLGYKF